MIYKNLKKRAFTLIELLIVIAIIGILFIVLVSKVDFATDKAKATGVQTTFRSYQMAFETVSRENAGFNTLGWNTGDNASAIPAGYAFVDDAAKNATIGDGIRNSYDEGDKNLNGTVDTGEVFTGRKIYTETWTNVYSLTKPGTTGLDAVAIAKLETAINANLDPALHITINTDGTISMANGMKDPWNKEYHGWYITNAETDGQDRGAIIMYSDGPNNEFGSEHTIANGVVTITVPNSNKDGKDDYALVSCYTFTNGYGETKTITSGFSNNQNLLAGSGVKPGVDTPDLPNGGNEYEMLDGSNQVIDGGEDVVLRSEADFDKFDHVEVDDVIIDESNYTVTEGSTIVTLKKEYLQTLTEGTHVVKIVSDDGAASANIIVESTYDELLDDIKTGDKITFAGYTWTVVCNEDDTIFVTRTMIPNSGVAFGDSYTNGLHDKFMQDIYNKLSASDKKKVALSTIGGFDANDGVYEPGSTYTIDRYIFTLSVDEVLMLPLADRIANNEYMNDYWMYPREFTDGINYVTRTESPNMLSYSSGYNKFYIVSRQGEISEQDGNVVNYRPSLRLLKSELSNIDVSDWDIYGAKLYTIDNDKGDVQPLYLGQSETVSITLNCNEELFVSTVGTNRIDNFTLETGKNVAHLLTSLGIRAYDSLSNVDLDMLYEKNPHITFDIDYGVLAFLNMDDTIVSFVVYLSNDNGLINPTDITTYNYNNTNIYLSFEPVRYFD